MQVLLALRWWRHLRREDKHLERGDIDVTVVEMADHVLPGMLDKKMAKIVERELEDNGVKNYTR